MLWPLLVLLFALNGAAAAAAQKADREPQLRARAYGLAPGIMHVGPLNAITDVPGVRVGHRTIIEGDNIRTGVTVIVPHAGNVFQQKVPAGIVVGNGYGKFAGSTQIVELGEIETPIALTNTLAVPAAMTGLIDWTLAQSGNEEVLSVNAVVGETNDGTVNDIRARAVTPRHVIEALESASSGAVTEGSVGAGTGTHAFAWKGGIGTSSRVLPAKLGGYTVGVLVQTNYGGVLTMDGIPVGKELGSYFLDDVLPATKGDGSVIIVIATDAPLSDRNLERVARRSLLGLGRTGSPMTNGSGDYALAFSTSEQVRRTPQRRKEALPILDLPNGLMSPLFQATLEATEEAVYNAIVTATTQSSRLGTIEKLPVGKLREIIRRYRQSSTPVRKVK
jgi:D-aminopeptidase